MSIFKTSAPRGGAPKAGADRRARFVTHSDDEILIRELERRREADSPVRCVHHLSLDGEAGAREAGRRVAACGWTIDWLSAQPEPSQGWSLRARRDVVVTREQAAVTRDFFEAIARDTGGSYHGWDIRRPGKHALAS